ncbi:DUF7662 domain-containing protein [Planosporangium mesophilum]|uniref:DUF7662 domain-containing protein n=1 Tax=Planosporangium mesophilum TaxID=689768 RepID=A0A8J3X2P0_9ACTN|nr:hypothetical protein [Planosporangium mesophilum]NJC86206.1 hypothetical protein [Planosporangium mesophilum]GII25702.1 hypothetical protein Pme01_52990 [Planosporangium mesophilum]
MAGKYHPLTRHLSAAAARGQCNIEMSFDEIAELVGGLPPSVAQRQWWANSGHVQASSWLTAGYHVEQVYLDRRRVRFIRPGQDAPTATQATRPAHCSAEVPPSSGLSNGGPARQLVDVRVALAWQPAGAVTLDAGGKLLFPSLDNVPGLYRLTLASAIPGARRRIYIGETENLRRRLAGNYRNPGPTQQTSLRINALLHEDLARGAAIELAIATDAMIYLDGEPRPLDLTRKAGRLLAENAALVHAHATDDAEIVNLG